jgi:hypothetical protein
MKRDEFDTILERLDKQDESFAKLFAYIDKRFKELEANVGSKADGERVYAALDGIAGLLSTDEQERAAITAEQSRHRGWIGQLAESTDTKLNPPLAEES